MSNQRALERAVTRQPIKLLFVPRETFPTFRGRVAVLFGRELLPRGHRIDLIMQAADGSVAVGPHNWAGRTVWVGPTDVGQAFWSRIRRHLLGFVHDAVSIWRQTAFDYDAVLVSDKFLIAAYCSWICKRRGLKFFFWLTFPEHESQLLRARTKSARYPVIAAIRGRVMSWMLYRLILPGSDHVFVQSPQMALNLERRCTHAPAMTPILTGFDPADFPARTDVRRPRESSSFTIAHLGTLDAERKLDVLVEMLALLRAGGASARLLLIGDGDLPLDREILERRAQELGVDRYMRVTGFLPRERALEWLMSADTGISLFYPSPVLEVASPTKLIEYMATGLPVIVNNQPEQRLVVHQSKAGVCTPWGARYFARAARWLMTRSVAGRQSMGESGRKWVMENRTYARLGDELETTLSGLLAPKLEK